MDGLSVLFESNPKLEPLLYNRGNALGWLSRSEKEAAAPYHLSGRLYLAKSGWLLLSVPNAFVRGLFDALTAPGAELPTAGLMNVPNVAADSFNAHISVMTADEVAKIGADKINERGHMFHYGLGPVKEISLNNVDGVSKVWAVQIVSPALSALRKSYGLSPLPNGDHEFHITIAARRKHVLGNNEVSKFDTATGRGELKAAAAENKKLRAVILKGNPKYVESAQWKPAADKFYAAIGKTLQDMGYTVSADSAAPHTLPAAADLWVAHSRGVDRFAHAPKGQRMVAVGSTYPGAINHPKDRSLSKELSADPDQYHFEWTADMDKALRKHAAAEELPWRERVEVYTRHPQTGKIYGGVWDTDKSFAVPGGGLDPGETPEQAALRELAEETGIQAANPVKLPIAPVDHPWSDRTRAEKAKIGRGNFAGSRTHFVMADFVKKLQNKNLDKWDATNRRFYAPATALKLMEGKQFMAPAVANGRMAALKHIIENAANKTAAADPATTILISGHSGAGKSTLAKALSAQLNMPLHPIDAHPDFRAFFTKYKNGEETVVGSPEFNEFQTLRRRVAKEVLDSVNGPAIVEGAQLAAMTPEELAAYKQRVYVHTPLRQLLKQRLERVRRRQLERGQEWNPEIAARRNEIGNAIHGAQDKMMQQFLAVPGTLKYQTRKNTAGDVIKQLQAKVAADILHGGEADNMPDSKFNPEALAEGAKHEHEHTGNDQIAREIANDHLQEDPRYYQKVKAIEPEKHAIASTEKEPAIILQLRAAKAHSDAKRYAQKNEILRKLMHRAPEDWMVDDPEKYHMGITHLPTNFRFHADPKIIPVGVPVQKAAASPYLSQLFNLDLQKNVPANASLGQRIFSQFQQAKQRGDWQLHANDNAQRLFAAMDPKYRMQRNMAIVKGEWPKHDTLTTLVQNYGDRALGAFA